VLQIICEALPVLDTFPRNPSPFETVPLSWQNAALFHSPVVISARESAQKQPVHLGEELPPLWPLRVEWYHVSRALRISEMAGRTGRNVR
jgi:hypothetical protein